MLEGAGAPALRGVDAPGRCGRAPAARWHMVAEARMVPRSPQETGPKPLRPPSLGLATPGPRRPLPALRAAFGLLVKGCFLPLPCLIPFSFPSEPP